MKNVIYMISDEVYFDNPCNQMFLSAHYGGEDLVLKLTEGEPWKKVFGPVFFYINSLLDSDNNDPHSWLWEDAKQQV